MSNIRGNRSRLQDYVLIKIKYIEILLFFDVFGFAAAHPRIEVRVNSDDASGHTSRLTVDTRRPYDREHRIDEIRFAFTIHRPSPKKFMTPRVVPGTPSTPPA